MGFSDFIIGLAIVIGLVEAGYIIEEQNNDNSGYGGGFNKDGGRGRYNNGGGRGRYNNGGGRGRYNNGGGRGRYNNGGGCGGGYCRCGCCGGGRNYNGGHRQRRSQNF